MPDRADIVYCYDGSYEGMLCCVYESFFKKEIPAKIRTEENMQLSLFPVKRIENHSENVRKVERAVQNKIGKDALETVRFAYYTIHPEKELLALKFIWLGMKYGRRVMQMLADETVSALSKAIKRLTSEAHQYRQFVRFSIYKNIMTAVIEPKHIVLPLIAHHFSDRYANEAFLIYDKTHRSMLLYKPRIYTILENVDYEVPKAGTEELFFRSLWKLFYDTVAIKERENPRCRMSHMQKRYWNHLTELQSQSSATEITERLKREKQNGTAMLDGTIE